MDWNRIESLLQAALDLPPEKRAAFVRSACGTDQELRRDIENLLSAESEADRLSGSTAFDAVAVDEPPAMLRPGERVGRYRVGERIGSGGMADVYEARDEQLQRNVALKTLPAEFTSDPERVRRFEQEAFAASRLNHPNIITIFEILHVDGLHLIAAERIEGTTLRALMTRKLTVARALDIAMQIAAALKAAHTAWIIHRDIKPENVMVRSDGLVKVLDFGIAKLSEEPSGGGAAVPDPQSLLTIPGAVMGTARYMSPEQARGEPLDGRTDLFSLGIVLQEMLAGSRIPRALQRVIARMLQPDRDQRYSSASEVLDDLAKLRRRIENRAGRRMVGLGALAVAVAVAVTAIGAWLSISETWEERILRDGHTAAVRQVLFSPDGRLLVTCGEDARMIVWDFARRQRVRTIEEPIHRIAFAPDGRTLAAGYLNGEVAIFDTRRWVKTRVLTGHAHEIGSLAFSGDGRVLAAGSYDVGHGLTIAWKTSDWSLHGRWAFGGFGTYVFSADQRYALNVCAGLFDLVTGERLEDPASGNWVAVSPDGMQLAFVESTGFVQFDRLLRRGDLRERELIARYKAHQDHGRSIVYSPDGRLVASAADHILVWDAATQQKVARFEHSAITWSVAFSPDGRWLVSAHGDGAVLVWDVAERERVANLNQHSGAVRAVAFSPDGCTVATAGEDRTVMLWDAARGRKNAVLAAHDTRVMAVGFSADGKLFASGDQDSILVLWDLAAGKPRVTSPPPPSPYPIFSIAVAPDGRRLITPNGVHDGNGRVIDDFRRIRYAHTVYGLAYSKDGKHFAVATEGGWVVLWDAERLRVIDAKRVPATSQVTVGFSPDGKWLATGEDQGAIRLWSTAPLRHVAILGRHAARVKSVAFSPDGRTVASAADDKVIALWDVNRRKPRTRIGTHASPVYSIAFSPDGRQLLTGEHDHTARIYTRRRTLWGFDVE